MGTTLFLHPVLVIPIEHFPRDRNSVQAALLGILNKDQERDLRIVAGRISNVERIFLRIVLYLRRTGLGTDRDR